MEGTKKTERKKRVRNRNKKSKRCTETGIKERNVKGVKGEGMQGRKEKKKHSIHMNLYLLTASGRG